MKNYNGNDSTFCESRQLGQRLHESRRTGVSASPDEIHVELNRDEAHSMRLSAFRNAATPPHEQTGGDVFGLSIQPPSASRLKTALQGRKCRY